MTFLAVLMIALHKSIKPYFASAAGAGAVLFCSIWLKFESKTFLPNSKVRTQRGNRIAQSVKLRLNIRSAVETQHPGTCRWDLAEHAKNGLQNLLVEKQVGKQGGHRLRDNYF